MAGFSITFTFDSGVEKLTWGDSTPLTAETTASPATVNVGTENIYIKPIFKNGYIIDTFTGVSDVGNGLYRSNILADRDVSFTSKKGATMKSYDLSTSTKWDSLSAGNHQVTIIAKASGYRDSASSTAVTVVKGSTSETWVLNETLTLTRNTFSVDFTANNSNYTEIWMSDRELAYGDSSNVVYATKGGWIDEANKTLVFATPPAGDLLTWLQANGTKQ